jgi:hypothetical protein
LCAECGKSTIFVEFAWRASNISFEVLDERRRTDDRAAGSEVMPLVGLLRTKNEFRRIRQSDANARGPRHVKRHTESVDESEFAKSA